MREIRSLTSLRGVAAMMVVLQHFSATLQLHSRVTIPSLVPHGYVAVDLFFVLSGFIMALTYGADFERRGLAAFPSFLLRRVARIIPLNTLAVGLIVLASLASTALAGTDIFYHGTNLSWDALCNLLLLQGLGIGANINAPSWSISTEFVAYLLFPILVLILPDRHRIARTICALAAAGVLCGIAVHHPRLGLDTDSIAGQLLRCLPEFVIGLATFRAAQSSRLRPILSSDLTAIAAGAWFGLMLLLRIDLLAVAAMPVIIATLACNKSRVDRFMSHAVLFFLGEVSFSVYLLHDPLRSFCSYVIGTVSPDRLSGPTALALAFVLSWTIIPIAWVAYVTVERPGRQVIRRLTTGFKKPAVAPV